MAPEAGRSSGQPKFRSSCDGCGAAKLKCDKGQPECGRCVSHGMRCVYGVSRKMGKPPRRDRPRPSVTSISSDQTGLHNMDTLDTSSCGGAIDLGSYPSGTSVDLPTTTTWAAMDSGASGLVISPGALDGMYTDIPSAHSLPSFPALDLVDWPSTDQCSDNLLSTNFHFGALPTPESSDFGSFPSSKTHTTQRSNLRAQHDGRSSLPDADLTLTGGASNHDCPQEAYRILGSLSFLNNNAQSLPTPPDASPTSASEGRVPLDLVLRLNREASEKLGNLMNCSCARSPHLALLYASTISRILIWYQQAAGCTQIGSPRSSSETLIADPTVSTTSTPTMQSTGLAVAPAKMAIGCFNVDDMHVQTALKMQLLSGEMKRALQLIDQFTTHTSSSGDERPEPTNDVMSIGGDGLYKSLDSWLRSEHTRITTMMKSKLGELSS